MDSFAQEVIDEIIDRIPRKDTPASSLVARRWRHRSQRRNFESVQLSFEALALWEMNIPQDPDGIPSYVHHARLESIDPRHETGTLPRVLKTFTSMVSLEINETRLPSPDQLVLPVSLGKFGESITRLTLVYVEESFAAVTSFIFSLPNLKELVIGDTDPRPRDESPSPIVPDTSQREPLELFVTLGVLGEPYATFALWRLASRRLFLYPSVPGIELLLQVSSETVVALTLIDQDGVGLTQEEPPRLITDLPSFPSLTRVRAELGSDLLTGCLAGLLSSIRSAPELSSVIFSFAGVRSTPRGFPSSGNWIVVDKWLAWMVTLRTRVKVSLRVTMVGWPEDNPNWEGYLPEFRRAGGELRRETHDCDYWHLRALSDAEDWGDAS